MNSWCIFMSRNNVSRWRLELSNVPCITSRYVAVSSAAWSCLCVRFLGHDVTVISTTPRLHLTSFFIKLCHRASNTRLFPVTLHISACSCPRLQHVPTFWKATFGSINKPPATKWTIYFWLRVPDHLVGREHHEEKATYCAGSCRSDNQETLRRHFDSMDSRGLSATDKRAAVHATATSTCASVCEIQMVVGALEAVQVIEQRHVGLLLRALTLSNGSIIGFIYK